MNKIKAKLTALVAAVCCCLVCLGVGVATLQQNNENVVAKAATTEELTAEFTNNGQFAIGQFKDGMSHEILDSTAEGVPEGAEGAVLKITGTGDIVDDNASGAFVTLDFSASKLLITGVDIVVRVYQPGGMSFRASKTAGSAEWKTQVTPDAGWSEVTLSAATNATEDHQILTTISMGFRRGTECYIDSIEVVDSALKKDFTNDGQFDVKQYGTTRTLYVDGAAEGLEGCDGAVLKIWTGGEQYATLDFSGSGLKASDVASMSAYCYLPNADSNGTDTYTDDNYAFRTNGDSTGVSAYGQNDMSDWFNAAIDVSKIATDANGYLTMATIGLRNKGNTASYFYIDSITVNMVEYTTYTFSDLNYSSWTADKNHIYLAPVGQWERPQDGNGGWNATFLYKDGVGVMLGETKIDGSNVKFPGSMFINLGRAPSEGEVLKVGGTFYNEACAVQYVIPETSFKWNGTAWEEYVEYAIYEIGALKVHGHSAGTTTNPPSATALYMASSVTLPFTTWDDKFDLESGDGFKLNGNAVTTGQLVSADKNLYVSLANANVQVGDVLSVSGTFVHITELAKYVITESKFVWNGTAWEDYVEYTTHTLDGLNFSKWDAINKHLYLTPVGEFEKPADGNNGWTATFLYKDGVGVMLGETKIDGSNVKFPGSMFINLGAAPEEGDKVTIAGTFYNTAYAVQYVVPETTFTWNGTTWVEYEEEPEVEYAKYELGALAFNKVGNENKHAYFDSANGVKIPTVVDWLAYTCSEGVGATINDASVAAVKFPGCVFIELSSAPNKGDKLVIGGTFYNETDLREFEITETTFWWNGTAWTTERYTTYELGGLKFQQTAEENKQVYLISADGKEIYNSELEEFTLESGVGVTVNGETVTATVKFPGVLFIEFASAPAQGDKLTIGGTFYNEELLVKYVVPETTLYWDEGAWVTEESPTSYTSYDLGEMVVRNPSAAAGAIATQLYLKRASGEELPYPDEEWDTEFAYQSGMGVLLNGEWITISDLESTNSGLFLQLNNAGVKVGDVITLGGTYKSREVSAKYVFTESSFMWNGTFWVNYVTSNRLETYDIITIQDIGLGEDGELSLEGTVREVNHSFAPSGANTTNSVVFRFGYICEDTALEGANLRFRLRGSEWTGIQIDLKSGKIYLNDAGKSYALASDHDYVIEIGAISMKDVKDVRVWTYVKLDDVMVLSEIITTSQFVEFGDFATTGFTNHFSLYAGDVAATTITDPDGIKVTYVSSAGTHVEKVKKNETYALAAGKGLKTFIGWVCDGVLYAPGTELTVDKAITFTAVEIDFTMNEGAAIRIGDTADTSGIRFTSQFNKAEFDALIGQYGIESIAYGTLIIPYDYLALNQKPNLNDFDPEKDEILKIASTPIATEGEYVIFRGAMQKMYEGNYGRLFAGRAYMEITFANGDVWTVYTPFDNEDNVRSIRMVAQAFKADTSEPEEGELRYNTLSDEKKAVVDAYIGEDEIRLMNYEAYEANAMSVIAWNFPALDSNNNYMNDANIAVANTMKEAGIKVIGLTGENSFRMDTPANIEKTRQIINFFWSQGIYTFAFQHNAGDSCNVNFAQSGYPDFSDCEGFMGFLAWDEPGVTGINEIATQVEAFEAAYAGTDVIFMSNLLPSYASIFSEDGNLNKAAFKAYLQKYCDTVLSKVSGEKWLSIDTYPILEDKTLVKNFLFDLGTLKTVALENGAYSHVFLQSYGWATNEGTSKSRMPSEDELRMQSYAAMAFGIDSISWFTYSPNHISEGDVYNTPVDENGNIVNQDNYDAFKNINAELTAIGKVYNAFNWKGIILGVGKDNGYKIGSLELYKDNDYKAFEMIMGQIGDYELSASDTKHLASVSTNKTNWNYLMGVMEDVNGNEGYVLCNYNSHEEDREQTITLTFDSNVTEVVIYRGGVAETVSVEDKTLTVALATGEGVIILPSKLG